MRRRLCRLLMAASWALLCLIPLKSALALPQPTAGSAGQEVTPPTGNADTGKTVWAGLACRNCHGQNGEGAFGPELSGRNLSFRRFESYLRHPIGIMPAYTLAQVSEQGVADLVAYFAALPHVGTPATWRTELPAGAPKGQELLISKYGCGQCHGPQAAMMRTVAGGEAADYAWFTRRVYEHTSTMPPHEPNPRMGNYAKTQLPESDLQQLWHYISVELGLRVPVRTQLRLGAPTADGMTYSLSIENSGTPGEGPTAQDLLVSLKLPAGVTVSKASDSGYQGVRHDQQANADTAVWKIDRLAPTEKQMFTITLRGSRDGGQIGGGSVSWARPTLPGDLHDSVQLPLQPQPE